MQIQLCPWYLKYVSKAEYKNHEDLSVEGSSPKGNRQNEEDSGEINTDRLIGNI